MDFERMMLPAVLGRKRNPSVPESQLVTKRR
jgi:hypothetical protein